MQGMTRKQGMSATKVRIVCNMRVRSNQKAKPKGNQHQENGKALFTETFLYSGVQWRLSGVVVVAAAGVDVAVAVVVVVVVVVAVVVVVVATRRRQRAFRAAVRWGC
jgi:Flp pilus assembly protein TadB